MGRVLLAALSRDQLDSYFDQAKLEQLTPTTVTNEQRLRSALDQVREQGWCLLDQELEVGVRSVAVPLHDPAGRVFAAMNISTNATRVPTERLLGDYLPLLRKTADAIDEEVRTRRSPT
jgi:IclR family transcriptional regulator, pca regulon regulatory protein